MNIFANQLSTMFFLRGIHIGYLRGKLKYKKKLKEIYVLQLKETLTWQGGLASLKR